MQFISETSAPLLAPFVDVFRSGHVVGFVFDFSTLLALFVYVFIGYLLIELMQYLDRPHWVRLFGVYCARIDNL